MNKSIRTTRTLLVVLALACAIAPLAEAGQAEPRYHLVAFPDVEGARAITDAGVILTSRVVEVKDEEGRTIGFDYEGTVVTPARDAAGNPVWDSDGDGVADGYSTVVLPEGTYVSVVHKSINESLDVVGFGWDANHRNRALLWRHGPDGAYTLVDLGSAITTVQRQAFDFEDDYHDVGALDINDQGQVLVCEAGEDWAVYFPNPDDPCPPSDSIGALVVITPRDVNGDGEPDTWFEDANEDGANDLMAPVELHVVSDPWDMNQWHGTGRINNHGQVVAASFVPGRGAFVVLPRDAGDGVVWFEDLDGDAWNDLATDLAFGAAAVDISDSGAVVGLESTYSLDDQYARWQIDGDGSIALVATENGECDWLYGISVNNQGDALAYLTKHGDAILWEAGGTIIKLLDLLDNPRDAGGDLRARDISNTDTIVGDSNGKAFVAVPLTQAPPPATPGITVEPTDGLITTEDGGTATFTIVLDTQPTADVAIALSSSAPTEGTASPASVMFTPADWDQPQTVTVTGQDDLDVDGDIEYSIVTDPAGSADPDYDGLDAADVTVLNLDDDAPLPSGEVSVVLIAYATAGPKGKDLDITLTVVDDSDQPVAGASVSIQVYLDGASYANPTGVTGDDGTVTFKLRNAPSGRYTTHVDSVTAAGLIWDEVQPPDPGITK